MYFDLKNITHKDKVFDVLSNQPHSSSEDNFEMNACDMFQKSWDRGVLGLTVM